MESIDDKPFWGIGEVLRLSLPASLSMLNPTLIRFADGWMVSHLGGTEGPLSLSAQVMASMAAMVPESLAMGILMVVNTHVSQNLGAGRFNRCGRYAWAGIWLAVAMGMLEMSLIFLAPQIFTLYRDPADPQGGAIMQLEIMYFRYMAIAAVVTLPSRVLESFFYGIGRSGIVYMASTCGFVVNLAAIYVLIFGRLGFPRLALQGAAIGSVLAWVVQFTILAAVFGARRFHERFGTRWWRAVKWEHCLNILRIGWPAGVSFGNDIITWNFMLGFVAHFGLADTTATSIAWRYIPLSFMPAVGIGIAATALVGRYIGEGKPALSRRRCHAALLAAMVYMGLCGACFWAFGRPMVAFFLQLEPGPATAELTENILRLGGWVMICAAVFQLFDAVGITYVGALRGAGETMWPMIITIVLSWGVIVAGGWFIVHEWPQLRSIGPWIAGSLYVMILGVAMAWRFETGAWEKIDLLGRRPSRKATEA